MECRPPNVPFSIILEFSGGRTFINQGEIPCDDLWEHLSKCQGKRQLRGMKGGCGLSSNACDLGRSTGTSSFVFFEVKVFALRRNKIIFKRPPTLVCSLAVSEKPTD